MLEHVSPANINMSCHWNKLRQAGGLHSELSRIKCKLINYYGCQQDQKKHKEIGQNLVDV